MVSHHTIKQSIQQLESAPHHEEMLLKILEIYLEIFPVQNAYLLRYSPLGFLAEGLIFLDSEKGVHIGEIRDDIRNFPIIFEAINDKQAKYCSGLKYLKQMGSKYTIPSNFNSMIVVPIFECSVVFAYICSSIFEEDSAINKNLLSALTLFGNLTGKAINHSNKGENTHPLSKRELEVMKRIGEGESTKEMADLMNISKLTVNQYVKTAIKKLGAKNRPHAISELFRKGILF